MTKDELKAFEDKLHAARYKKYFTGLTSSETYGWFKYWKHGDELLYMIEFRIWDYNKYTHSQDPYFMDILILDGDSNTRIDMEITFPKFDIKTTEEIAKQMNIMLKPFIKKAMEE